MGRTLFYYSNIADNQKVNIELMSETYNQVRLILLSSARHPLLLQHGAPNYAAPIVSVMFH